MKWWLYAAAVAGAVLALTGATPKSCDVTNSAGSAGGTVGQYQSYAQSYGGYGSSQEDCLNSLWTNESHWDNSQVNPESGAYGIPQANPDYTGGVWGAFSESDWQGAIRWGVSYISDRYHGSPCEAWNFWQSQSPHWY